jgi:L-lactate utilization protein LutB
MDNHDEYYNENCDVEYLTERNEKIKRRLEKLKYTIKQLNNEYRRNAGLIFYAKVKEENKKKICPKLSGASETASVICLSDLP